jgi:hypothetical protein
MMLVLLLVIALVRMMLLLNRFEGRRTRHSGVTEVKDDRRLSRLSTLESGGGGR